jgi:RNA polymerase sigma-70 factor (ECF subfamily)
MIKGVHGAAVRHVRTLFEAGTTGGLTDRQLIEQFRDRGGPAGELAFGALVQRHGPMVLRVCRSILQDEHAVEDSFQATFLVLVRRARSLWVRDSLGPWIYQVAFRAAISARSAAARRRRHEQPMGERADPLVHDRDHSDIGPLIHEELYRLPERYRAPIVLCCMEGLTHQEAAGRPGWPLGTVESRLARGRERLRARLIRRGIAPAAGLMGTALSAVRANAGVTGELEASTIRAAMRLAAGELATSGVATVSVVALAEGVTKTMMFHKLKLAAGALLAAAMLATGVGVWARQALRAEPPPAAQESSAPSARSGDSSATAVEPTSARESDEGQRSPGGANRANGPGAGITVKFGDGEADGKKSVGGSGEMIKFEMPEGTSKLTTLRIHGSRYGQTQPPRESFLIYFLSPDQKRILQTEMAPYSLFKRGPEEWVEVRFDPPVAGLAKTFWVVLDFRAAQTKGVYVSFDTSTGGKFSRVGLPGLSSSQVNFGGDWMIQASFVD